jgi:hypothetical protein
MPYCRAIPMEKFHTIGQSIEAGQKRHKPFKAERL